jgi:hypothetical protein
MCTLNGHHGARYFYQRRTIRRTTRELVPSLCFSAIIIECSTAVKEGA